MGSKLSENSFTLRFPDHAWVCCKSHWNVPRVVHPEIEKLLQSERTLKHQVQPTLRQLGDTKEVTVSGPQGPPEACQSIRTNDKGSAALDRSTYVPGPKPSVWGRKPACSGSNHTGQNFRRLRRPDRKGSTSSHDQCDLESTPKSLKRGPGLSEEQQCPKAGPHDPALPSKTTRKSSLLPIIRTCGDAPSAMKSEKAIGSRFATLRLAHWKCAHKNAPYSAFLIKPMGEPCSGDP